jgi:hypothetical protein
MPVLPAKSLHFTSGHPINADLPQGVLDFIQFGKGDYGFNFFHNLIHWYVFSPAETSVRRDCSLCKRDTNGKKFWRNLLRMRRNLVKSRFIA